VKQGAVVDVTERTVTGYQTARLKEKAAPKTVNEEVGFLFRVLGEGGELIRARLRRHKSLKLATGASVGKVCSREEKAALLDAARKGRSAVIYPALMLALNAGMRDAEIRGLQWGRLNLVKAVLPVGESKTEAGEGRTIPLNSSLLEAMVENAKWFTERFKTIQTEWFVFPFGKPTPNDPTRAMVSLKTAWCNVKKRAGVTVRWHDNRQTLITDLAESGAGDETIRHIGGHVSKQMLKHYSHIRMAAKRSALESIVRKPTMQPAKQNEAANIPQNSEVLPTKSPTRASIH